MAFDPKKFEIARAKFLMAEARQVARLIQSKRKPYRPYYLKWRRVSLSNIELRKENRRLFSENQKLRMDLIREVRRSLSTLDL